MMRGRRSTSILVGLVLAVALVSAQAPSQDSQQLFRSRVDIVSLNVTVVDGQNRYVTDLTQDDFSVFEDGTRQDLILFNRTNLPIALSLLIDTSASMENRMAIAQDAATGFARTLRQQDLAQVVDFDSRVEILRRRRSKFDARRSSCCRTAKTRRAW
jgi:VWFA-related protein